MKSLQSFNVIKPKIKGISSLKKPIINIKNIISGGPSNYQLSVSRNSSATFINKDGKYSSAAPNVARIHHTFSGKVRGLLIEKTTYNKNFYARPSIDAIADHFTNGYSYLSIVDDSTVPIDDSFVNNKKVWEVNNTSGGVITLDFSGTTKNTNIHNIQGLFKIISGAGYAVLSISGANAPIGECRINNREWGYKESTNITPFETTDQLRILVPDGMIIRMAFLNMQEDKAVGSRQYSRTTTPIDTNGASSFRNADFITIPGIEEDLSEGSLLLHGSFYGGENFNVGVLSVYESGNQGNQSIIARVNDEGDFKILTDNNNNFDLNDVFGDDRGPTPLDVSFSMRWKSGDYALFHKGIKQVFSEGTSVPINLNEVSFFRRDSSANNESDMIITAFELYNTALSDPELENMSYKKIDYCVFTFGQSNSDVYHRGYGGLSPAYDDGIKGGGAIFIEREFYPYVSNFCFLRGPASNNIDYGGGALLKSTNAAAVEWYVNDDDPNNLELGLDALKVINHIQKENRVNGVPVRGIFDHWQYESDLTPEEIAEKYKPAAIFLFENFKKIFGSDFKIYIQEPSKRFNTDDSVSYAFRKAFIEICQQLEYVFIGYCPYNFDLNPDSNAHYAKEENYIDMGRAVSKKILKDDNIINSGNCDMPRIINGTYLGNTINLICSNEHDAELTAITSSNLFRILKDGQEVNVSSWSVSGNVIKIICSESLSGTVLIDYPYYIIDYEKDGIGGGDPSFTDENKSAQFSIKDDSSNKLPLASVVNFLVSPAPKKDPLEGA